MERSSLLAMRVSHTGKILTNIALLGTVVCLATVAYFVFLAMYYLVLITILLGTLFLILIPHPEFMDLFTNTERINEAVISFSTKYVPIIAPITFAVSAVAVAALFVSRQKNANDKKALSIICLVASFIFTVIFTFMGGGAQ